MDANDDAAVIDQFLAWLGASKGRRPRTLEAYRMALVKLQEFLEGSALVDTTPIELETFCGVWLHKRGVVARSRKPYVSAVRGFYTWAQRRGLIKRNPAAELSHPKVASPLPTALSLASAEKLMWAPDLSTFIGLRDAAMISMLVGCGMRVSGLVGLNETDLRTIEIDGKPRLAVHVVEKGDKERALPLPREAEMLLRVYLDHEDLKTINRDVLDRKGRPDKVLFVNSRNTRVPPHEWRGEAVRLKRQSVWRAIQRYGEAAGVPAAERHPHAFRHLFGVELAEEEVDLLTRQDLMGHSDPKHTAIYTSMSMRRRTRVIDESGPLAKLKTPVSELLRRL